MEESVPVTILSDSLLPQEAAPDYVDTLLPCSPSQLVHTDVAAATLKSLDEHDQRVEAEVGGSINYI